MIENKGSFYLGMCGLIKGFRKCLENLLILYDVRLACSVFSEIKKLRIGVEKWLLLLI